MGASRAQESSVRCGGTKKLELPCRSCRGAGRAARLKPPIPSTTGESRVKSTTTGAWFFAGLSVLAWLLTAYLEKLATGINTDLQGATGRLQLDGFGNVVRTPSWSTFAGGRPAPIADGG